MRPATVRGRAGPRLRRRYRIDPAFVDPGYLAVTAAANSRSERVIRGIPSK
jgi:hypothetical protein